MTALRARLALTAALAAIAGALGASAAALAAPASCTPGSGVDLHGRRLTAADLDRRTELRCANLSGADLSGLDVVQRDLGRAVLRDADLSGTRLIQADLTQADLTGARLTNADLTQATLDGAVLSGADLSHAHLGQVDARSADFTGADLSHADLTQAHLEGARLDRAQLAGVTTTQAYLHDASFTDARGVRPWDRYLLIGAGLLYALFVVGALRKHARRRTLPALPQAIVGGLILVVGVHLFAGFVLGRIASATGPPIDQTCNGVQCSLGVAAGAWAPFIGFLLVMIGAFVAGAAGRRVRRASAVGELLPPPVPALAGPAAATPPVAAPPIVAPPIVPLTTLSTTASGRELTAGQMLLPPEVLQLALAGNKRAAARRYRELTGSSRWEASSVLEGL